ncbi:MAG: GAP family protein [Mycobacterium sp.]|uniref:GAP family protein n=1 Tax=Mycobacterium sp. TaxID=1785 RepID=UPI003F990AF2
MWGSLLVLTLMVALDPVRLGATLLMISRPRPLQNMLVYWIGGMTVGVTYMLGPLMVLHVTPFFRSLAQELASPATFASSTVRHIQIGIGVLALSLAALMAVRFWARPRAQLPTPGGTTSTLVTDSSAPSAISPLLGGAQDEPTEGGSAIRRLLGRARNAWEDGSLWVAFVIGVLAAPPPFTIVFVLTTIMATGAAIGTQVGAAIAFVVGIQAVVEIALVSHLFKPAKTQAVLRLLHDWTRAHRQKILVAMCVLIGVALVAQGSA